MSFHAAGGDVSLQPRWAAVDACARLLVEAHAEIINGGGDLADAPKAEWKACVAFCRQHRLLPVLHENPLMLRVDRKPHGYPGDSGMIDYIYRIAPAEAERLALTTTGRLLLESHQSLPSCCAVRERKRLAAQEIDTVAAEREGPTIVSLAAAHLREAPESAALRLGRVGRFVAIDQDPKSIDTIRADYVEFGVECAQLSVLDLLRGPPPLESAHLIYALGLFDYLEEVAARRLTAALPGMLAPGGRLLIANFTPGTPEAGYMEAVGDWYLTYRTPAELESLTDDVDARETFRREIWTDDFGCVAYMRIRRRDYA